MFEQQIEKLFDMTKEIEECEELLGEQLEDAPLVNSQEETKREKNTKIEVSYSLNNTVFHKVSLPSEFVATCGEHVEITLPDMSNDIEKECKFCHETEGKLIAPCKCSGSVKWIHPHCLDEWRTLCPKKSSFVSCDICNQMYVLDKLDNEAELKRKYKWLVARDISIGVGSLFAILGVCIAATTIINLVSDPLAKYLTGAFWQTVFGDIVLDLLTGLVMFFAFFGVIGILVTIARCCCCQTIQENQLPTELDDPTTGVLPRTSYLYLLLCYPIVPPSSNSNPVNSSGCDAGGCSGGDCSGDCGGCDAGEAILVVLLIILIILVIIGIIFITFILVVFVSIVLKRHLSILKKKSCAGTYVVRDLSSISLPEESV